MAARSKGEVLPTMRGMLRGEAVCFPLDRLGAARTASWWLNRNVKMYFKVEKHKGGGGYVLVERTD